MSKDFPKGCLPIIVVSLIVIVVLLFLVGNSVQLQEVAF